MFYKGWILWVSGKVIHIEREDLGKIAGPLYAKTGSKGQKNFNIEDVKLVQKIKEKVKNIPDLKIPLESDYLIIQTDGSDLGWGAILKARPNKYSNKNEEQICGYQSGAYKEKGKKKPFYYILFVLRS